MTPNELQNKYDIKRGAYYNRLKFLGIKAKRDSQGKAYLTEEDVAKLDELHSYINKYGKMSGFITTNNPILQESCDSISYNLAEPNQPKDREKNNGTVQDQVTAFNSNVEEITSDAVEVEEIFKEETGAEVREIVRKAAPSRELVPHHTASRRTNSIQQPAKPRRSLNHEELEQTVAAVRSGKSVLILGEAGSGKNIFAKSLLDELNGEFDIAIATYKGSLKKFLVDIAEKLDIPTTNEKDKSLTADGLKAEIAMNTGRQTLLLIPEIQRAPASLRYWLEELLENGVKLIALAITNPRRDLYLSLLTIELSLPSDAEIRAEMKREAQNMGLKLSHSQLASLQTIAGRNLILARKVVQSEALGLKHQKPEHTQYIDISPVVLSLLTGLGILRFIGMGTGNRGLYIVGGVGFILAMMLKQIGNIRGSRRRYGQ